MLGPKARARDRLPCHLSPRTSPDDTAVVGLILGSVVEVEMRSAREREEMLKSLVNTWAV